VTTRDSLMDSSDSEGVVVCPSDLMDIQFYLMSIGECKYLHVNYIDLVIL